MPTPSWQKSSYCQEGDACVHLAATASPTGPAIQLTESADPTGAILTAPPAAFAALLRTLSPSGV
ncbi:DUF397 domain-containing protein [Streptomyces sp. NPDC050147]|uniref:DUF397 domain-containing protein n=1 Tax=Streptomyces sp. NPDC050147 TaxID=3155513 RepID=UPI00343F0961